jgi:hypothetical protein
MGHYVFFVLIVKLKLAFAMIKTLLALTGTFVDWGARINNLLPDTKALHLRVLEFLIITTAETKTGVLLIEQFKPPMVHLLTVSLFMLLQLVTGYSMDF